MFQKSYRVLILTAALGVALMARGLSAQPLQPSSTASMAEKVVKVVVEAGERAGSATAFHIGRGKFLTNKHVCDMLQPDFNTYIIDNSGRKFRIREHVNSPDAQFDLCIFVASAADLPVVELARDLDLTIDELLTVTGYPAGNFGIVAGKYKGVGMFPVQGSDGEVVVQFSGLVEAPIIGGNSGSPIMNKDGKCVGVVNAGNGEVGLFVPLGVVKEFLKYADGKFSEYK